VASLKQSRLDNDGRVRIDEPDLREYGTPEQIAALYDALAEARKAFRPVQRTKHVNFKTKAGDLVNYDYAPYSELDGAVCDGLAQNGLKVEQPFTITEEQIADPLAKDKLAAICSALTAAGGVDKDPKIVERLVTMLPMVLAKPETRRVGRIRTILSHKDGGRILSTIEFHPDGDIKGLGGQTTYLARYAMQRFLGLDGEVDADELDDSGKRATVTDRQPRSSAKPPRPTESPKPAAAAAAVNESPEEDLPSRTPTLPPEDPPPQDDLPEPEPQAPAEEPEQQGPRVVMPLQREQAAALSDHCKRLGLRGAQRAEICRKLAGCEPTDLDQERASVFLKALASIPSPQMAQRMLQGAA
jgi:hypothetical protein